MTNVLALILRQLRRSAAAILISAPLLAADAPKNVLLLVSDNHSARDLGCYGHPQLATPNLDALARAGTRFSHAYATVASCGPSRAVIYTGLLTHANGQFTHGHSYHNGVLAKDVTTIFDLVKKGGYRTALFGKTSFDPRAGQYEIDQVETRVGRNGPGQAKLAEEFIREGGNRPFLIAVTTLDPQPTDQPADVRRRAAGVKPPRELDPARVVVPPHLPDRPDVRVSLAEYYELIERLDAGFGLVLEALQRTGQAKNTLVLAFSDQGAPYPNGGYSQYEPGVHVPLIVLSPVARRHGVVSDALVTLADITPTILEWTGVKPPPYRLHGRSLLPVLEREHAEGWDSVVLSHVMHEVTMYYPMRTIRERRYKLIWNLCYRQPWADASEVTRWSTWAETWRRGDKFIGKRSMEKYIWRDPIELYDLQTDPEEVVNLADEPRFAETRRALSEKLLVRLRETGDNWLERYQLPMPGEQAKIGVMSPPGYAPDRRRGKAN
ncbi:MAG: sulfatase [Opitutaceae bacterium]|nr:sulfatase [Opitutaceae bacterium]